MNAVSPHKLIGNGTSRRCGFAGAGMALLKKCVTVGVGYESSYMLKICPGSQFTYGSLPIKM